MPDALRRGLRLPAADGRDGSGLYSSKHRAGMGRRSGVSCDCGGQQYCCCLRGTAGADGPCCAAGRQRGRRIESRDACDRTDCEAVRDAGARRTYGTVFCGFAAMVSYHRNRRGAGFWQRAGNGGKGSGRAAAGDGLVLTKWIALAGTAALAVQKEEELGKRFPLSLIKNARGFAALMPVLPEARIAVSTGAHAMHDLSQGGVFGALWEMAERADVGLDIDLKRIPIRQETVEICEYFDLNPYNLYSAGSLLIGTREPETLVQALVRSGISASVIGCATERNERIIRNGEDVRFLDRPAQDEWYRKFGT